MIKVGINGFGRIGRLALWSALDNPQLEIVAVNDLTDTKTLAHLLKYDSIHGKFSGEVSYTKEALIVNGKEIRVFALANPGELPWSDLGVEIVIEATGRFTDGTKAKAHLSGSVKRVIISAPAKNEDVTLVMGVNEDKYDPQKDFIISNASCTTNCLAPIAHVLDKEFGIVEGLMTTIHAYTNDQRILDLPHEDLRRARAAGVSIIPTSTGAAKALGKVLPKLDGKLNGMAFRVPTAFGSVVDLTVTLEKPADAALINEAMAKASSTYLKGYLGYTDEPLVSVDFIGDGRSSIVDGSATMMMGEKMVKVVSWYDNEWAYACRIIDLACYIGMKG